jgi:hypothetical protein
MLQNFEKNEEAREILRSIVLMLLEGKGEKDIISFLIEDWGRILPTYFQILKEEGFKKPKNAIAYAKGRIKRLEFSPFLDDEDIEHYVPISMQIELKVRWYFKNGWAPEEIEDIIIEELTPINDLLINEFNHGRDVLYSSCLEDDISKCIAKYEYINNSQND